MQRTTLLTTIAFAVAVIICYSSNVHAASVSVDALKAQFLPAEFRNKNFTMDDAKRVFREKCKKASGIDNSTLYQDVEKGVANLTACLSGVANMTAIQEEIELARPIGELDTVFHKYCTKVPVVEDCLKSFNAKIQPCLTDEEKKQNAIMSRLATNLMGFMCAKGGDQIALFVAEDGPECFEANKEAITNCANSSFAEFAPKDGSVPDIFNLPELVLKPEHCIDLARFEACTLHHLQQCQEITPANVAESVFKFVKNETSCTNWIDKKSTERSILKKDGDGAALSTTASTLMMLAASLVLWICNYKLF